MGRRLARRYWEEKISVNIEPKKVIQVYCGIDLMVNDWLMENSDVEIVDIKLTGTRDEELVMVVYKTELED